MLVDLHTTAATRLRRSGQRYTANRRVLVEVLADADHPLTIPEILELRSGVAQSSAYRNLSLLEEAGVVHRLVTHDEFARYELAEELTEDHHHHLVCSRCGFVADVAVPQRLEAALERELAPLAGRQGFAFEHHRLDLIGLCRDCRNGAS